MPGLADLPREILLLIFAYTDPETVLNSLSLVSKNISTVSRDSLLWHKFLTQHIYPIISFPAIDPATKSYWEEYVYQLKVDAQTSSLLKKIVADPDDREKHVAAVSRLGLRARPHLVRVLTALESSLTETSSCVLREKYYARELLIAINQRHSVTNVLNMLSSSSSSTFDAFDFLMAFDSFYLNRSPEAGPSCEASYPLISTLKKKLLPFKKFWNSNFGPHAQPYDRLADDDREAIRNRFLDWVHSLGSILFQSRLINDISRARTRNIYGQAPQAYFLHCILNHPHRFPANSLIASIIYCHFAKWIGLKASVVVLEYDSYVRIEDPTKSVALPGDTECFFVDPNRQGKIRTPDEMRAIISLARGGGGGGGGGAGLGSGLGAGLGGGSTTITTATGVGSAHTSLDPSPSRLVVDMFLRHFTDGYPMHHDSGRTSAIMLMGVMMFSFVAIAARKYSKLPPGVPANPETNNTRVLRSTTRALLDQCIVACAPQSPLAISIPPSLDERLTHLYTMAMSSIVYKIPCALTLAYDFLFPLVPAALVTDDTKRAAAAKLRQQLDLQTLPFTEQDYEFRRSFSARPKYHIGQIHYIDRAAVCGVIVGWSYVSHIAGRNYRTAPAGTASPVEPQSPVQGGVSAHDRGMDVNTSRHRRLSADDTAASLIQYVVLPASSASGVLRVLEPAINLWRPSHSELIALNPAFFGLDVGRFFDRYDDTRSLFVPGMELLKHYPEERVYFKDMVNNDDDKNENDENDNNDNNDNDDDYAITE
ncbi:uncharacterized protein SAPINGB_P000193 [Magnusiomyces paraingens]|uniref:F-box domain-containing protein n=1 Tax=Magnusiomyces paraingens TaxID=2606893 RepID=A0A5E8B2N6_9ASCO|nr:uncharacterized protein SAPINGB_P000193 [Saprochaete ingens]VVT43882.1 unnamed protein product [Saprochaete ingens]